MKGIYQGLRGEETSFLGKLGDVRGVEMYSNIQVYETMKMED